MKIENYTTVNLENMVMVFHPNGRFDVRVEFGSIILNISQLQQIVETVKMFKLTNAGWAKIKNTKKCKPVTDSTTDAYMQGKSEARLIWESVQNNNPEAWTEDDI